MGERKRILLINSVANYGSTGHIVEAIGKSAQEFGWDCYLACGERYSNESSLSLFYISSKTGQRIQMIHSLLTDRNGFSAKRATFRLIEWIKRLSPDIIHLHNLHGYYLNISILFGYLNTVDIPVVWTLHDCWPITGHCCHFHSTGCEKWMSGCDHCSQSRQYPVSLFSDRSARNYLEKKALFTANHNLHLVVVSEWMKMIISKSFLKDCPITVIPNGISMDVFHPLGISSDRLRVRYGLTGKCVLLGVATRWWREKGYDDWLELKKILPEKYAVVMIGVNKRQQAECERLGILGLPKTENIQSLVEWYSVADVCMSLSHGESFGLTLAESLACGTPVITYGNTAQLELVSSNTGMIAEDRNVMDVLACLETMAANRFSADNCRNTAMKRFNQQENLRRYMELYNSFIH